MTKVKVDVTGSDPDAALDGAEAGNPQEVHDKITAALLSLDHRRSATRYMCPAHADQAPSLNVTLKGGRVLLHCLAGCETRDVMKALGMTMGDLRTNQDIKPSPASKRSESARPLPTEAAVTRWANALRQDRYWSRTRSISREVLKRYEVGWNVGAKAIDGSKRVGAYTFPYRDEDGRLLNVKQRWQTQGEHGKTFLLVKGRPTDFLWPADQLDRSWVVLVEGEPDALRLISLGLPAVTGITGVKGSAKSARTYAPSLEGLHVVVAFDSSAPGRKAAAEVANTIAPYAETVRVFDPFPQRDDDSDMSDWFDFYGNDVDRFKDELRRLPVIASSDFEQPSRDFLFPDGKFNPPRLGIAAEEAGQLRNGPGRSLWRYEGGLYRDDGEQWLAWYVRTVLKEDYRDGRLREVRSWCNANFKARIPTQPEIDYINVRNGILFWREDPPRLEAHSPDIPSIIQLGATWNPKAKCPAILDFLEAVLPDDALEFIFEWIGYLLIPTSKYQRALMLEGPRDTGKSTLLLVIGSLLASTSVSHHTLQSICDDRFTRADLYGRLANIYADLDARAVQSSGTFKTITTGDPISAEHKFGHSFSFRPFVRQLYSANEPPGTSDQSDAYYKRWLVVPLHHQFKETEQDPNLEAELTSPDELSGLLTLAVEGLKRLEARGRFAVPASMKEAASRYRANTDTVVAWGNETLEWDRRKRERLTAVFVAYTEWCDANNRRPLGKQRFEEHLLDVFPRLRRSTSHGYPVLVGASLRRPDREDATVIHMKRR